MNDKPRLTAHPQALFALLLLAFGAGILVARVVWPAPASQPMADAPVTATPVPPTPTSLPTPTATSPDLADTLPTLYIDIAPDDFAQIEAKREEALADWILRASDADFVNATIRLGTGDPIPVELRLKGDWADHFVHEKWSYRVEVDGGHALLGMRVFSLQDPSTRTYLNEWLFLENLRAEDVLAVSYRFVHVVQNGQAMGIYALEEGFSKELVESQNRREGVIVRYDEDLLWEFWSAYTHDQMTPRGVMDFHLIDEFQSGKVRDDPTLSAQRDVAIGEWRAWRRGERPTAEVFDIPTLAKFLALTDLWGSEHAVRWHNVRFYYNPVTTRLEPVAFDTQALEAGAQVSVAGLRGLDAVLQYDDPALYEAYARYLWEFSQPAYLATLQERFGADFAAVQAAMMPEFGPQPSEPDAPDVLTPPWEALATRQAALREMLSPVQMAYVYAPSDVPTDTLTLDVGNLLSLPIEVMGAQVDETWVPAEAISTTHDGALVLPPLPREATFMPYTRFDLPATLPAADAPFHLVTRIWGLTRTVTQPVLLDYPQPLASGPIPTPPTLDEALTHHAYLEMDVLSDTMLTIPPGTWLISGSLILPEDYGLRLEPGTTLRFAPDAFLLARGPLVFEGTERAPVTLQPTGATWDGIVVIDAQAPSYWRHVTVEDTSAISWPDWTLTGGITFYQSPIRLAHCRILGTQAEDGFNTIRTRFEFVDTAFVGTASDAFDADFCQGVIERCTFTDILADGIDISGSEVQVRDVVMRQVGDKGLSVGEASRLTGERLDLADVGFGVASKDLSHTTVRDVTIRRASIAGLAAYIKKPAYGPASIQADEITLIDVAADTLVQTGSWIDLEGTRIWGVEVDVDALYAP